MTTEKINNTTVKQIAILKEKISQYSYDNNTINNELKIIKSK